MHYLYIVFIFVKCTGILFLSSGSFTRETYAGYIPWWPYTHYCLEKKKGPQTLTQWHVSRIPGLASLFSLAHKQMYVLGRCYLRFYVILMLTCFTVSVWVSIRNDNVYPYCMHSSYSCGPLRNMYMSDVVMDSC